MFNHSPIQHARRDIPPTAFLLQGIETLEDDTFPLGETISDVWESVIRVSVVHDSSIVITEDVYGVVLTHWVTPQPMG